MKLSLYYDPATDTLSLWNGQPASEGDDVAENLTADLDGQGNVVGFTLDHAAETLGPVLEYIRAHQATGGKGRGSESEI